MLHLAQRIGDPLRTGDVAVHGERSNRYSGYPHGRCEDGNIHQRSVLAAEHRFELDPLAAQQASGDLLKLLHSAAWREESVHFVSQDFTGAVLERRGERPVDLNHPPIPVQQDNRLAGGFEEFLQEGLLYAELPLDAAMALRDLLDK